MHPQWLRRPPAVVAPLMRRLVFQAKALALAKLPDLMQATLPELKYAKLHELMHATLPELKHATHATKAPTHVSGQGAADVCLHTPQHNGQPAQLSLQLQPNKPALFF
jgi:hypothetical protein